MIRALVAACLVAALCSAADAKNQTGDDLPDREVEILEKVARANGLTDYETRILLAIRATEKGAPGLELGVMDPRARVHKDGFVSLVIQADWASHTIKHRYREGGLDNLAAHYCERRFFWRWWVRYFLRKWGKTRNVPKRF